MSKRLILAAALAAMSYPAAASAQPAPAPAAAQAGPRTLEQVIPEIDRMFERHAAEAPLPGLVYGIVKDGRLIHVRGFGVQDLERRRPVTANSLFRIASMSKAFTGLAILKLRDEGRLSLDAPAETYVPEMRGWNYPTADSPRIRVRDLLNHIGGLVTDDPWGDRQQPLSEEAFSAMIRAGVPFSRPPQTEMEYSNFGYALLGRIITNASGRRYQDYIREEIMRPLGMVSTGYDVLASPPEQRAIGYRWENDAWSQEPDMADGAFGAMGGIETSAADYARWVAFLLSGWPPRDDAERGPVRRATIREMAQGSNFPGPAQRPQPGSDQPCRMPTNYGMGLNVLEDCDMGMLLMHGGGYPGYGSFMMLFPESGIGLFAFTNRTYAAPVRTLMETALALHAAGLMQTPPVPVSPALTTGYETARAMFAVGTVAPAEGRLAMNFLMDRSADNWTREFARLKDQAGPCRTDAPITASGNLTGTFSWVCEKGILNGRLLLAPTATPQIQALRFGFRPTAP